jgi:TRAP-type C4-dicarboxylate transport system permease large subunit
LRAVGVCGGRCLGAGVDADPGDGKAGLHPKKFAAAITAASSIIGPIIPPSGIMIIYAYVMGESVAALFLAGIVPGIMIGGGLMMVIWLMADRELPRATRRPHGASVARRPCMRSGRC